MVSAQGAKPKVEVHLPNHNMRLEGQLVSADPNHFTVLFDSGNPSEWQSLRRGATVYLFVSAKEMLYRVQAQVAQIHPPVAVCALASPPAIVDRRTEKRYIVSMIVHVHLDDTVFEARITNISRSGARLVFCRALPVGTQISLQFPILDGNHEISARAEVCYTMPAEDGTRWFHGLQFTDLSRTDALWLAKLFP